ncbi:MAG: hypothetical protein GF334_01810 [Candidatus Altiarchaeales archaeon]|nr:hypothetical protein [Candidatus Altiarchaeales archaeon]
MNKAKGISGLVLLPARPYEWELKGRHTLEVPIRGKVSDLLKDKQLASGVKIAGEDNFTIYEDNVFLLWELVRVLFAQAKYPSLEEDECFNVVALETTEDTVLVHGEVIKAVLE